MATAKIIDPKTQKLISEYYMYDRLKKNLDEKVIIQLQKKDKDCIVVVDGREGSGKSTLAIQMGKYVDPTLNLERIVFSPEDFREAILKAKKGQCIIYDEAFTGFSSRNSLSPVNRVLVSLAMQMRQKNLFVIIVLPTIFLLDKYMAIFRTKALIHVYESKGQRGYFKLFNSKKKKLLILLGQRTMSYTHKELYTKFSGRFYGKFALGDEKIEKLYREKKEEALASSEKTSMTSAQVRFKEQRDLLVFLLRKTTQMKFRELSTYLNEYNFSMSFQELARICAKYGDLSEENDTKSEENNNISTESSENVEKNIDNSDFEHDFDGFHS